jgi:hypothetical protein
MTGMLETPSRIWRRIEAIEDRDMPSLPSVPAFDDSEGEDDSLNQISNVRDADEVEEQLSNISAPMHSTPTASSHHASTMRAASSTSSASRFANSIARTSRSSTGRSSARVSSRQSHPDSFDDVSAIPSLPDIRPERGTGHYSSEDEDLDFHQSKESVPDVYLPPEEDVEDEEPDLSLTDALESVSRTSSPQRFSQEDATPKKNYDYSVSLRSEPKVRYISMALSFWSSRLYSPPRLTSSAMWLCVAQHGRVHHPCLVLPHLPRPQRRTQRRAVIYRWDFRAQTLDLPCSQQQPYRYRDRPPHLPPSSSLAPMMKKAGTTPICRTATRTLWTSQMFTSHH